MLCVSRSLWTRVRDYGSAQERMSGRVEDEQGGCLPDASENLRHPRAFEDAGKGAKEETELVGLRDERQTVRRARYSDRPIWCRRTCRSRWD
jgi:hypothetical protein